MPVGSDGAGAVATPPALPHTWRPLGPRIAGAVFGVALVAVCAFAWFGFDEATRAKFTVFQRATLLFLGALAFSVMYALMRSRVVAEAGRVVLVNGYRRHEVGWSDVEAVRLAPGAPWATLELTDGRTVAAMGIQGSDGARAQRAVRELRAVRQDRGRAPGATSDR